MSSAPRPLNGPARADPVQGGWHGSISWTLGRKGVRLSRFYGVGRKTLFISAFSGKHLWRHPPMRT